MSIWMLALLAAAPAIAAPAVAACRGEVAMRLVGLQLATAIASLLLLLMSFAFDQPSFTDLGLTLALLALPGTLLMAVFIEAWL